MAPKPTTNAQNPKANKQSNGAAKPAQAQTQAATPAAQPAAPQAATTAQAPAPVKTPEQTDVKKILAIADRKLTRGEATILRKAGLKKDGTTFTKHSGPRTQPNVTLISVKNAVETFGAESLAAMQKRYGKDLKKPLRQYINTLTKDSDDQKAMNKLYGVMFPADRKGGFNLKDDAAVNKQGRASVDVRSIGGVKGARVSKGEVVTLADGRVGLFITVTAQAKAAAAEVPTQQAAPVVAEAPAPSADQPAF